MVELYYQLYHFQTTEIMLFMSLVITFQQKLHPKVIIVSDLLHLLIHLLDFLQFILNASLMEHYSSIIKFDLI